VKPAGMRKLVLRLQEGYRVSERRAVKALGAHRSAIRYRPKRPALDAPIRKRTEEIAAVRIRYGYRRIHILLQREGWSVNFKRGRFAQTSYSTAFTVWLGLTSEASDPRGGGWRVTV
jgi:putative transposase